MTEIPLKTDPPEDQGEKVKPIAWISYYNGKPSGKAYCRKGDAWDNGKDRRRVPLYPDETRVTILRKTLLERIEALRSNGAKGLFGEGRDWPQNFDFGDLDEIELLEAYEHMLIEAMGPKE